MKSTILLDMGNTLVRYYRRDEFPGVLRRAVEAVRLRLAESGRPVADEEKVARRIEVEDPNPDSPRVKPLEGRLSRIFEVPEDDTATVELMCRAFMGPIFELGIVYDDVPGALADLRARGLRLAIVSNTPWGSPSNLWREELARLGIAGMVDAVFFCRDAGWRKPDERIFHHVLASLDAGPDECVFVGDDPRWDVAGPRRVGMDAILICRHGECPDAGVPIIRRLDELDALVSCSRPSEGTP
jgi:FMN phosphatase YigB (HAD superfamily)